VTNDKVERKTIRAYGAFSKNKYGKRQSAKRMRRMGKADIADRKENS
jgi:hypothetical protein